MVEPEVVDLDVVVRGRDLLVRRNRIVVVRTVPDHRDRNVGVPVGLGALRLERGHVCGLAVGHHEQEQRGRSSSAFLPNSSR